MLAAGIIILFLVLWRVFLHIGALRKYVLESRRMIVKLNKRIDQLEAERKASGIMA